MQEERLSGGGEMRPSGSERKAASGTTAPEVAALQK